MSHTWKVAALDYAVSQDGHTNVVTTVHWTCCKEDENGNSGYAYGTVGLEAPSGTFVEWADISEATAVGWAKAAMGDDKVDRVQASVDAQIAEQATPTTGTGVPW